MFDNRLKALRELKGLTREQAALRLEIKPRTYTSYENNEREPSYATLVRIARYFGVSTDFLLGMDDAPSTNRGDADEHIVVHKYNALTEEGRRAVDITLNYELERSGRRGLEPVERRSISYFCDGVSAGVGAFAVDNAPDSVLIPLNSTSKKADFAVKISGDSMEPNYSDGDIALVRTQPAVELGEVGIFALDDCTYIKAFGGSSLISYNPNYRDIPIDESMNYKCVGKVLGKITVEDIEIV